MTDTMMNCERLDAALGEYLEGDADARTRASIERHAGECLRCASVLRSLQRISAEAATLPELEPTRDLWPGIASRIEAPVIPLAPAASRPARRFRTALWAGAAAAALVAVTAGVTYTITVRQVSRLAVDAAPPGERLAVTTPAAPVSRELATSPDTDPEPPAGDARPAPSVPAGLQTPTAVTYNREITQLKDVLEQRRTTLDPATVAIVESSLRTIDTAIAEARGALARDPSSVFLANQLNKALEKKLGLLRTVALLPRA
jgi:hypothetical protein